MMVHSLKPQRKYAKIFLVVYIAVFAMELMAPLYSLALTSGPAQPETSTFTPASATDMVNTFTGGFSYNIPLFELPGPNGGYPFNLAYSSGAGMDEEASWVGLGWNLNPGAITRNMRGLPDDFDGEIIKTDLDIKKNYTVGINMSFEPEVWSFDMGKGTGSINLSLGVRYNSYTGFGAAFGTGVSVSDHSGSVSGGAGFGISLDSDDGASADINASLGGAMNKKALKEYAISGSVGLGVNSRTGLKKLSLGLNASHSLSQDFTHKGKDKDGNAQSQRFTRSQSIQIGGSGNVSFSSPGFTPQVQMPMKGFNISINGKIGADIGGTFVFFGLGGHYSEQKLKNKTRNAKAYGYLNLQNGQDKAMDAKGTMMDVNREKDGMVTRFTPNLAAAHLTYDVFSVAGQGMMEQFRPYRNDIGASFDDYAKSNSTGGGLGIEAGLGMPQHIGISVDINHSESWSGTWAKRNSFNYPFTDKENGKYYEPTYFKATGEHTAEDTFRMKKLIGDDHAMKLNLTGNRDVPELTNEFSNSEDINLPNQPINNSDRRNEPRKPRANNILTFKNKELSKLKEFNISYYTTITSTNYRSASAADLNRETRNGYSGAMSIDNQIGGITATNPDGMRYVYGIPAYNNKHVECSFSSNPETGADFCKRTTGVNESGGEVGYRWKGTDEYRKRTNMPPYAHSYLLTSVLGADYIDLDNNGPSDDDLGYWVKFNYVKTADNYRWRAPYNFNEANYIGGYKSDKYDDKGAYLYGEKENWQLATAETKTHVAVFLLSARHDGLDAAGEITDVGSHSLLYKLDRIDLYSKNEYKNLSAPKPLQSVHFNYTYELCGNALNNDNSPETVNSAKGKLTLKSVYFTYENSTRGALAPYKFDYGKIETSGSSIVSNPTYNPLEYDRWGQYSPAASSETDCKKIIFPYVNQSNATADKEDRIKYITAWNLTDVHLPSGADIHVSYEQNDYAYVQDKTAMQMYKIVSLNGDNPKTPNNYIYTSNSPTDNSRFAADPEERRIYFELKQPINGTLVGAALQAELDKYIDENKQLYFKVYAPMRKGSETEFWEYVSGYLDIEAIGITDDCKDASSNYKYAYIVVKRMTKSSGNDVPYHPLTVAILQTLKQNLPQFAYKGGLTMSNPSAQGGELILEMCKALGASFATIKELFTSFYRDRTNSVHRWANQIDLNQSFIRLNCPDKKKYGGGLRVKKVEIHDNWTGTGEATASYGQEYDYTTEENGVTISSGVATYEPIIGGEENALRFAKNYPFKVSVTTESNMFYEYPINETLYPGASIGYSKVTVRSINTKKIMDGITTATGYGSTGVTENYFYTAKDYPVISEETALLPQKNSNSMKYLKLPIPLPGLGNLSWDIMAASQGYLTQLNDMHGKPRKVISYGLDNNGQKTKDAVSSVEYIYFDEEKVFMHSGDRELKRYRVLKNEVPVLIADPDPGDLTRAKISIKNVGVDYELFTDQRQSNSYSVSGGLSFNIELATVIPFPFPWPNINYSENEISLAVTNKVIHRSGILKKIIATDGQSVVTTENKCFDAFTGAPLLTTVTNDFDDNIWKYEIPAYLKYDKVGAAYGSAALNFVLDGSVFTAAYTGNDTVYDIASTGINTLVRAGDELLINGGVARAIVDMVDVNTARVTLRKGDGGISAPVAGTNYTFSVVRSGNRNMLNTKVASIVALKDPTKDRWIDSCKTFEVFSRPNPSFQDSCLLTLNLNELLDTISGRAREHPGQDVFIPFSDRYFSELIPTMAEMISMGYIGILVNDAANKITFKNINGNDCVWTIYHRQSVAEGLIDVPVGNMPHFYPPNTNPHPNFPQQHKGATFALDNTDEAIYQYPENCFCKMLFSREIINDTIFYDDVSLNLDSVITTSAAVYSDDWNNNFEDARFSGIDSLERAALLADVNDYMVGRKGIWRNWLNFSYHTERRQKPEAVKLREDGTFIMSMFDWQAPLLRHCDSSWVKVNEVTKYNAFNYDVENKDALNIYSAALYGFKGKLPIAVASNSTYSEFGFESFEEYNAGQLYNEYTASPGNITLTTETATAGSYKTVYDWYRFDGFNGSLCWLNIYNCVNPAQNIPLGTTINGVKVKYRPWLFTSRTWNGGIPLPYYNTGNLEVLGSARGNIAGKYLPTNPIAFPLFSGIIGFPRSVHLPSSGTALSNVTVTSDKAHSGKKSFKVSGIVNHKQLYFHPAAEKKYEFSAWVSRANTYTNVSTYKQNNTTADDNLKISIYAYDDTWSAGSEVLVATLYPEGNVINKWQKIEGSFTLPYNDKTNISLKIYPGIISGSTRDVYVDDVRVFPSKGNMISYVYDKDNYRLKAELNNNNFATYFFYDEEGKLYLKKQETDRGVYTVQEAKVNVPISQP